MMAGWRNWLALLAIVGAFYVAPVLLVAGVGAMLK